MELLCEDFAEMVIHQIKSYPHLIENLFSEKSDIYCCRLAKKLFDVTCLDKIVSVTDNMAEKTPAIYGSSFDYKQFLAWLKSQSDLISHQLKAFKRIYGDTSLTYKYYIERYCAFLFSNALKIVEGITEYVPIYIYNYTYSSARSAVKEWVTTLSETIEYVNNAVQDGDIKLSQDSKQMIGNIDNQYCEKLMYSCNIIYESFFKVEAELLFKQRIYFLDPNAFLEELKRESSNFIMLFSAILNICGDYPTYHKFIQECLCDFVSFEERAFQETKNHICIVDADKLSFLEIQEISEINNYNNQLKTILIEIKEELMKVWRQTKIPENIVKNINPKIHESLLELTSINIPTYPEIKPIVPMASSESEDSPSFFRRLIRMIFD